MSGPRHFCPLCPASFHRQEHLDRHRLSHGGERPFTCTFCARSFKRCDVLQRHWRTCKTRLNAGAEIPRLPATSRPQKRRACERCARLKKACSLGSPCEACRARKHECTYRRSQAALSTTPQPDSVTTATSEFNQPDLLFPDFSLDPINASETLSDPFSLIVDSECALSFPQSPPMPLDAFLRIQPSSTCSSFSFGGFDFLDSFTTVTGFVSSFECLRVSEVQDLAKVVTEAEFDDSRVSDSHEVYLDFLTLYFAPGDQMKSSASESCRNCTDWLSDSLVVVTNSLVCGLKKVTEHRGAGSSITLTWSPLIERVCTEFFSPPNIRRYLVYFWSFWYPNCPMIHRPTFDIYNTPHTLLLSMLLIGSSFAPEESVNRNAKLWFHIIISHGNGTEDFYRRRNALKALQAAYFMCLLQNWEGDDDSRRRIRRVRFSMVTSIAREVGFAPGSHHQLQCENDWARFIAKEEFNRTLAYIFLLDTAFVIFNNTPPKVSISELNIDPLCSEECFQESPAAGCLLPPPQKDIPTPIATYSLTALISRICQGELDNAEQQYIAQLGKLNLFILVSAFHTLLFHARNTFTPQAAIVPIQQGLNNWIRIWKQHEELDQSRHKYPLDLPPLRDCWKRTGFMQYAPEYCTLAQCIIISIQQTQTQTNSDPDWMSEGGRLLSRFDENDMEQLNRFIRWVSAAGLLLGS
ncbi:hypothetical protein BDW59DRAFT_177461 [Aspergillus cavernicola]|uniref:C2H2-type domain-containing protein n=1 Tax=Aspergillus cavernicola TaxID=176166 RepID=A0ABR4HKR7_9EURO